MSNTESALKTVSLYFTNGGSDKEYHARIEESGDGYLVNFAYGRRGSTLTTGTKTQTPVDYAKAVSIFEKLVNEKTRKGYTPGEDGTPFLHSDKTASGLHPQLLTVLDDAEVSAIVADPAWCMQEKFDGRRMMLRKTGETVEAINKLGLVVGVSAAIADAVAALPGDIVLDGEAIGDRLFVFDLLSLDGNDLTGKPYRERYSALVGKLGSGGGSLVVAQCWMGAGDKAVELAALRERNAEGAVFKHLEAPYTAGRPNSGGPQRKHKFVDTCSAVVTTVNDKRSVSVSLLDGDEWKPMGNVTIPANQTIPAVGDVVEVRYLYAIPGGSLYQPVYLGLRDDIEKSECVVAQLKYKAAAS